MSLDDPTASLAEWLGRAGDRPCVLPAADGRGARVAGELGVSSRALLDAVARRAAGIAVDDGWIRILASGADGMHADLASWNGLGAAPIFAMTPSLCVVGFDVLGGVFAMDAGALGGVERAGVHYFGPDTLRWEPLGAGYSAWLAWLLTDEADVASFYEEARWPSWRDEVRSLGFDEAIHVWPPAWTREGKDRARVSRRTMPAHVVVDTLFAAAREIDRYDVPGPRIA
ncbi:MAG: DUF2625 family protein [Sandaracinus sp.]